MIERLAAAGRLLAVLAARGRWFLLPCVVVLLLGSLLLVATQAMPWLAPFVYVVF